MSKFTIFFGLMLALPAAALARTHEIRVPLRDGQLSTAQLLEKLDGDLHLVAPVASWLNLEASLNVRGVGGWLAVRGLNRALGEAFHLSVSDEALIVEVDPDKLPEDWKQTAVAVREFTEEVTPDATARHRRQFGLIMPAVVDAGKPLVIVMHGLDGDGLSCRDLRDCLEKDGKQAAIFSYPAEQPIADNVAFFAKNIQGVREKFPGMKIDLVAESMGALIARQYVEGADYPGGVEHLILIAPPNGGSDWTPLAPIEKIKYNFETWQAQDDWSASWLITEGLDESVCDLKPGSKFLETLNALPRRPGVKYTIIAGNQPVCYRMEAEGFQTAAGWIGDGVKNWWGFRQTRNLLQREAKSFSEKTGAGDGPVDVEQARLAGVSDFVVLPVDHLALYHSIDGKAPAAWAVIHDRLDQ